MHSHILQIFYDDKNAHVIMWVENLQFALSGKKSADAHGWALLCWALHLSLMNVDLQIRVCLKDIRKKDKFAD